MSEREQNQALKLAEELGALDGLGFPAFQAVQKAIQYLRAIADRPEQPLEEWRDDELADSPTPKAQEGTWALTAPDGRTWQADSPLRCAAAEANDRVPPDVQLARIARSIADDRPEPAQPMAHEPVGMVVDNEAALFDRFKGKLGNDTLLYTAPPSRPAPSEAEAERQSKDDHASLYGHEGPSYAKPAKGDA